MLSPILIASVTYAVMRKASPPCLFTTAQSRLCYTDEKLHFWAFFLPLPIAEATCAANPITFLIMLAIRGSVHRSVAKPLAAESVRLLLALMSSPVAAFLRVGGESPCDPPLANEADRGRASVGFRGRRATSNAGVALCRSRTLKRPRGGPSTVREVMGNLTRSLSKGTASWLFLRHHGRLRRQA